MPSLKTTPLLPAVAALFAACSADGAGPSHPAQVTLHVATRSFGSASLPSVLGQPDTLIAGRDTLVLDQVALVLRDIRFDRVEDDRCDDGDLDDGVSGGGLRPAHDDDGDGDESCEHFRTGPILVDLPLGPGVDRVFSVAVEPGTYDEIRFKIHKPGHDDPADAAFLAQHPEFAGVSIRVTGSFDGVPFTFLSDLDAKQEQDLVPPLVVTGGTTNVDVTLRVDIHTWFGDGGGGLVDPATANRGGPNERLVRDNIRDSFRAFRDDDHDGEDDGDDHHGSDDH
jgi:hypothetical protein